MPINRGWGLCENEIKRLAIDSHVQLYDEFIGTELYHQIVAQCDYILPIHSQTTSVDFMNIKLPVPLIWP